MCACVCVCVRAGLQQLRPALDLLCSAIRDSHSEAQSRQFSDQLLSITISFVNTQIRTVLSNTHCETHTHTHPHVHSRRGSWSMKSRRLLPDEDEGVRSCVDVLGAYVTQLRSYMKKLPWPAGGATLGSGDGAEEAQRDEWACLQTEVRLDNRVGFITTDFCTTAQLLGAPCRKWCVSPS